MGPQLLATDDATTLVSTSDDRQIIDSRALRLLRDAWDCAVSNHLEKWQLAVELEALRTTGVSNTDLRRLVIQGVVEHREETTCEGDRRRRFRPIPSLAFTERVCFVLTGAGGCLGVANQGEFTPEATNEAGPPSSPDIALLQIPSTVCLPQRPDQTTPVWDEMLHELQFGGRIVKRFRAPAPAQEQILSAFQEEGWPPAIHDPLPVQFHEDPKRRLHHTIRNLNRAHVHRRIRFFVNGRGETIRWELLPLKPTRNVRRVRVQR